MRYIATVGGKVARGCDGSHAMCSTAQEAELGSLRLLATLGREITFERLLRLYLDGNRISLVIHEIPESIFDLPLLLASVPGLAEVPILKNALLTGAY